MRQPICGWSCLNDGQLFKVGTSYLRPLASAHYSYQIKGSPDEHKAIVKFHTMWCVRTSPGYSCLFIPPLNRHSDFTVFSGVIDTDKFYQQISPPAVFTRPDGNFIIPKGTPIVQVIPFRREKFTSVIRPPGSDEGMTICNCGRRSLRQAGIESTYRYVMLPNEYAL